MAQDSLLKIGQWFHSVVHQQSETEVWITEQGVMCFGRDDYSYPSTRFIASNIETIVKEKTETLEKQFRKKNLQYAELQHDFEAIFEDLDSDSEMNLEPECERGNENQ